MRLLCIVLLTYTFLLEHENEPVSYIAYVVSAYTTVVVCVKIPKLAKSA